MGDSVRITGVDGPDGLKALIADLERAAIATPVETRAVVQKGALNVKKDAQERSSGIRHAPRYPYTITYDTTVRGLTFEAEIGPDPDKHVGGGPFQTPGNLGAILEYGTPKSAPIPHLAPALEAERPKFERALEDLGRRSLENL
jgi:hypothetical protein